MYKVEWDAENNLAVLTKGNAFMNNEVRPVFSAELKNVGFDKYVTFEESDSSPVLWATRYQYYYRGQLVARLQDNGCLKAPSLQILDESFIGAHLPLVDVGLWFQKNEKLMNQLVQDSLLRIYRIYMEWKDRVDYIYAAYSGGKDSMVLLDLVRKALPHGSFFVAWIDSGMESRYSVEAVRREQEKCRAEGIAFLALRSILDALETWKTIGPPSFENRWCCSVLRSVPNTIQLKEYVGKGDARSLVFLGKRADESSKRMRSGLVEIGVKHKSQIDANGIINWNSLEIFLHLMMNGIQMNQAYKEGYLRIGCLVCPLASTLPLGFANSIRSDDMKPYFDVVRSTYKDSFADEASLDNYINLGEWRFRGDGHSSRYHLDYSECIREGLLHIETGHLSSPWEVWLQPLGVVKTLEKTTGPRNRQRVLVHRGAREYEILVETEADRCDACTSADYDEEFLSLFKIAFRKAAACIGCRTCEVECPHGHLHFRGSQPVIDEGCLHCGQCHSIKRGCVVFNSWFDRNRVI